MDLLTNNILSLVSALLACLSRCSAMFCSGFSVLQWIGKCLQSMCQMVLKKVDTVHLAPLRAEDGNK